MKLDPIVISLLDTDLYKFNMDQVIFHKHTDLCGKYYFKCRNKDVKFTPEMLEEINAQIDHLCTLRFRKDELDYLRSIRFIKNDYVEFLRLWHPIREYVTTSLSKSGELSIIVEGPLFSAMQFEIHLLEIVNEVYFRMSYDYDTLLKAAEEKLNKKIEALNNGTYTFTFAEFGCRHRLSREWEDVVVRRLATETKSCTGTSNVYLAMKYNLTPIGTYAHEFVQMYQGIDRYPLAYTNHYAMRDWYDEYDGDNGTALTDTITTDLFLMDFTTAFAMTPAIRMNGAKRSLSTTRATASIRVPSFCCSPIAWTLTALKSSMTTSKAERRSASASVPSAPTIPTSTR